MPRKTDPGITLCYDLYSASMRPRPDAAENPGDPGNVKGDAGASMRPRPDAAENGGGVGVGAGRTGGFNEAAARCRGKHAQGPVYVTTYTASMRPRPDAAENVTVHVWTIQKSDASMRPRPDAAENQPGQRMLWRGRGASMRPRPDAAENRHRARDRLLRGGSLQ